ncbi:hypothetical protein Tco_0305417 [Tanacetum coccineum]
MATNEALLMDSQYFKDKALLMEAKAKGDVLNAEAEALLADVECTAPYDQPQALTTTNMFQANHEDAYDSDVDEGPNAAVAFMANLSSTSATNNPVNEVHSNDNQIFDNVDYQFLGDKNKHLLAKTRRLQRVMTDLWNDNERFIADNIAKDICSFVLSSEKQVSPRSNCSCKELQSNYDKGHSRVVALEAEVLEKQQMLAKSEHQSSLIQKQFVDLQLKFQNYKERLQNEKVCVPPNATASNAIVEINQLK